MIDDLTRPLDLNEAGADDLLDGIQGNILRSHGRNFTAHVLLRMTGQPDAVRRWIARFASENLTSAAVARSQAAAWRDAGGSGEPFAMFLLAPDGYRRLGFTDEQLPTPDDRFNPPWGARYFRSGMKGQATIVRRRYNDPDVSRWEPPYQGSIHAMVLLADDSRERLDQSLATVLASIPGVFEELTTERGSKLTQEFPRGTLTIEHFGYQDGVSNPLMIQQDVDREVAERGSEHWDPQAPLSMALLREPGPPGRFGSFMVFRKLEQDVRAFWDALQQLAALRPDGDVEALGAMAVGRSKDGTPVVSYTEPKGSADPNDFDFDLDAAGLRCPLHAHIRKTNPRGDIGTFLGGSEEFERARRIVRRGITFGERPDLTGGTGELPSTGVGLLFMCFQSNLDQFAIQQEGSDSNHFVRRNTGVDAVIGQNDEPVEQTWSGDGGLTFTMANFVRMLGGEYFFAPSMAFLKTIADGPA